jgi:hypothetical protein
MLMKNEEDLVEIDLDQDSQDKEQKWVFGPIYQKDTGMQMLCGVIFK